MYISVQVDAASQTDRLRKKIIEKWTTEFTDKNELILGN